MTVVGSFASDFVPMVEVVVHVDLACDWRVAACAVNPSATFRRFSDVKGVGEADPY